MTGAGSLLRLIRNGEAVTRADLVRRTGLARSTVAQRLDALLAHQLVYEAGGSASTGGRPPTVLAFNQGAGVVLVADLGATHSRLVVSDLAGAPLAETTFDMDIADGPEAVLDARQRAVRGAARARSRRAAVDVRGIGVGVPGPVAFSRGEPVAPPIMPGWDGFSIPDWFAHALRRAGARRQRREHHGAGRALDALARRRAPAVREDRHRHRLRHRRRRAGSTAAPRARPATSATSACAATTTSSAAAATSAASRPSPAGARSPRTSPPSACTPSPHARSSRSCARVSRRRSRPSATRAATSARSSPAA